MRAFLCLTPDSQSALAIDQWSAQCWPNIERPVPAQNLHITLAFLGDVSNHSAVMVCDLMEENALSAPFTMCFDKVGYWPQPQVLWLGSNDPPGEVLRLASRCKQVANRAGIRVRGKRFEPHITLARKPTQPPQSPLIDPAFTIDFDAVQLCESFLDSHGARYVVREEWRLTA